MMIKKRFELKNADGNDKENRYHLNYGEDTLMLCNEDEKIPISQLVIALNNILQEKEIESLVYMKMNTFYEKLIEDTLQEKLKDIDNMYAMKLMLSEMCSQFDDLIKDVEGLKGDE